MTHRITKISSALLLLIANTSLVHAGTMGDANTSNGRIFFEITPFNGAFDDNGGTRTVFAEIAEGTSGAAIGGKSYLPTVNNRWGYKIGAGYRLDDQGSRDIAITYTDLNNSGFKSVSSGPQITGGEVPFINTLTLIGTPDNPVGGIYSGTGRTKLRYNYQSIDLLTHSHFTSDLLSHAEYTRFYGIKATEIRRTLSAQYVGLVTNVGNTYTDIIHYSAKYYGIGPEIGMGAQWPIMRYLTIGGNADAALLFGTNKSQWHEITTTANAVTMRELGSGTYFNYAQTHDPRTWAAAVLGGDVELGTHLDFKDNSSFALKAGIAGEQYLSSTISEIFSRTGANKVVFNNLFALRELFIKLNYYC